MLALTPASCPQHAHAGSGMSPGTSEGTGVGVLGRGRETSPSLPVELMTLSGFSLYLNHTRGGDLQGTGDCSSSQEER